MSVQDTFPYEISLIIPLYNVQPYILTCLESVAAQVIDKSFECLIIDDRGTDSSVSLVKQFIEKYTGSISFRLIHHTHNRGLSAARNTGISESSGKYISFVDSDDYVSPEYLSTMYKTMIENPEVSIVSSCCYIDVENEIKEGMWHFDNSFIVDWQTFTEKMLLMEVPHVAWGKLFDRSVFERVRFREGRINEDVLFSYDVSNCIAEKRMNMIVIPDCLYFYRQRQGSICNSRGKAFFVDEFNNLEEILSSMKDEDERLYTILKERYFYRLIESLLSIKNKDNICHSLFMNESRRLRLFSIRYSYQHLSFVRFLLYILIRFCPFVYK